MVNGNLAYADSRSDEHPRVQDSPLKWCTVSLSDVIARGKRLEASVFDVDAKQAWETISHGKYPVTTICGEHGLATAYVGARFKRIWVNEGGLPIYQPSTIMDIMPIPDGYISHKTKVDIEGLKVHKGQVLMTCSGTIGKTSYVSDTLDNKIFSHDLLRIICKNPSDAGYLYTYFKSKIGNKIITTNQYGAVISHIEPEHLSDIPVPNAPDTIKRRIHTLVERSYSLRDESNDLMQQATTMLVNALHLPPITQMQRETLKGSPVNSFSVKLSDLQYRVDASYHVPIVKTILSYMQSSAGEITTIGDKTISKSVILPGRFKRVYVEEGNGRVFIGGKQLYELDPSNKKYLSIQQHGDRISKQLELHENMTLITCSGTIGKVALVGKHWENWTANQHIIRVVPASQEIAGYICVFLMSDYGHQLITHNTYGSVVDEIDDSHVSSIPFPLLKDKEIQNRINNLALLANRKRYEAYCLEQQAMQIMNSEVIFA